MADINLNLNSQDFERAAKAIQKAVEALRKTIKKTGTTFKADAVKAKQYAKATTLLNVEKKKLSAVDREQIRLAKQLTTVNAKLTIATSKEARVLAAKKKQLLEINRQLRTGSKNTASWGKALGSFQFKFNALGNIAANVTSRISRGFTQAMRGAIKTIVDFDQAMADVKSITGATGKEFDQLSQSARNLGGSTKFTAVQVAQLQKEYSKLGFTTSEIIKVQKDTLALAAATGTELARSAEVVGITIRQFGFDTSETKRVVDVMAKSFTSSALDMEKFAESMKFVGPAAKASNISLERTTAILGQLADAGISGSMAGTSLRQIMLALSKESGTFAEKMERAAEKGFDLAGAVDEVQKSAATAFLVMADGVDTIDDFTEALLRASDAADEMARVQLNTLANQAELVRSAWAGMILEMTTTDDELQGTKRFIGRFADALNAITISMRDNISLSDAAYKIFEAKQTERIKQQATHLRFLASGFKSFGKWVKSEGKDLWEQLFPKAEEIIPDLENIDDLLENLKDTFTEEDQEGWDLFGLNHWLEEFNEKKKPQ